MKYWVKDKSKKEIPENVQLSEQAKRDRRLLKIVALALVGLLGLGNFLTNTNQVAEYLGNINWILKPYANIRFEKVNDSRPNQHIVLPSGLTGLVQGFNTFVTYDDSHIYFYESLALKNPVNRLDIDGQIKSVSCCYFRLSISAALSFAKKPDLGGVKNINDLDGLFIHCQYADSNGEKLAIYHIDSGSYSYYAMSLNRDPKLQSKLIEGFNKFRQEGKKYPFLKLPGNISDDNKIIHPALSVKKLLEMPFDDLEFYCFAKQAKFISKNTKKFEINLHGQNGKIENSCKIGKPFIYTVEYNTDCESFFTFDGTTAREHDVEKDVKQTTDVVIKGSNGLKDARFIPADDTYTSMYYEPILVNDGKIYTLDFREDNSSFFEISTKPDTKMTFYNTMTEGGKNYQCDLRLKERNEIPYKTLGLFNFPCKNRSFEPYHFFMAIESGLYINLCLDTSKNNKPTLMIDCCDKLLTMDTSGIDEPVNEAYLVSSDGDYLIYFMNNKSIYQTKFTEDNYYNFKLMKLAIKPGPVKEEK